MESFEDERPHVALAPYVGALIEAAHAGDPRSWGRLYGMAAGLVRAGQAIPEPLAAILADRLGAMASALTAQPILDTRQALRAAVVPGPAARLYGPKQRSPVRRAAEAALDLLEVDNSRGRRKAVVAQVAAVVGCTPVTVDREINAIRKERRAKS